MTSGTTWDRSALLNGTQGGWEREDPETWRTFSVRQLAREANVSYATTWRLVEELRRIGLLRVGRIGPSRAVAVNETSPLLEDLRRLKAVEAMPHRKAARRFAELLSGTPGVEQVILFGSVAEGRERPGSDVDVAVVYRGDKEKVFNVAIACAEKIDDETDLSVVPVSVTRRELGADTQFARALARGEVLYERPPGGRDVARGRPARPSR